MSRQEEFDYLFKIVMIGDSGVGKTNLLSRFVDGTFTMDSKPTIGVEFATKTLTIDNKTVKNQIWDTAGQERFRAITNAYYRGAVGAIIVYDLTKSRTFENIQKWHAQLKENAEQDITIMLLGNKSDLESRQVKMDTVEEYINQNKLLYMETSARTGQNVEEGFSALIKDIYEKMKIVPETPTPISSGPRTQKIQIENEKSEIIRDDGKKEENKNIKIKSNNQEKEKDKKKGCC